jgi:hypothetical protein
LACCRACDRVDAAVERAAARDLAARHLGARAARPRDGAHGARRVQQRGLGDVVGIGESGLLAAHRAHADALVDAEAAGLDDALFQAPAFAARVLEVEVGVVDLCARISASARAGGFVEAEGLEQQRAGRGQALDGGFAGDHRPF